MNPITVEEARWLVATAREIGREATAAPWIGKAESGKNFEPSTSVSIWQRSLHPSVSDHPVGFHIRRQNGQLMCLSRGVLDPLLEFLEWKLECYSPDINLVPEGVHHAENMAIYIPVYGLQIYLRSLGKVWKQ